MQGKLICAKLTLVLITLATVTAWAQPAYLPGGPLAGLDLPPNPRNSPSRGVPYGEVELYPGSVEHWRDYWMKYCPNRSLFDAQSLVRRWTATELAKAAGITTEMYAEPVFTVGRDSTGSATGETRPPVPVVRGKVSSTYKLDLGTLDVGMYCLRIIGAVESSQIRPWRKPLFVEWKLNDGVQGGSEGMSTWRRRLGYVEEFYSVEELFFHATERRAYHAELTVASGSEVDLLIAEVILDDALAGSTRRPIKRAQTITTPELIEQIKGDNVTPLRTDGKRLEKIKATDRWRRDEAIWKHVPPPQLNSWGHGFADAGRADTAPGLTSEAIAAEYGVWETDGWTDFYGVFTADEGRYDNLLINKKLGLKYTVADLWAGKPLPAPYPFPDPAGHYWPDPADPAKGASVAILPRLAKGMAGAGHNTALGEALAWLVSGEEHLARDGAIALIACAYNSPAYDHGQEISSFIATPSYRGRDTRFRQRHTYYTMAHYPEFLGPVVAYDRLFPYIKGNEDLAKSIQRFVPWVQSSEDLIELLDVFLVQTTAKRILRYHYHTGGSAVIATPAAVLADPDVCDPWMQWLFSRGFTYPLPLAGMQDIMIAAHDRLGAQYIGSHFYARGEGAFVVPDQIELYRRATGTDQYDLSDPRQYHQPLASCYWDLDTIIGGYDILRIGDVTGPEKMPGQVISTVLREGRKPRMGWQWSKDPSFAWVLKHLAGRRGETDAQWAEIEAAAATVGRAPWLDNASRVIANWAGVLEAGRQHDDYRFRRAAYVRAGVGSGHEHYDTLDLQVFAHGMSFNPDAGQRGGYSKPNDRFSRVHNVVEVNGGRNTGEYGLLTHAWVRSLSDADGASYMRTDALHPQSSVFLRQTSLIDVDEGHGSQSLTPAQQAGSQSPPADVTTANSYVFDVFRVSGGSVHTYNFHGPVHDDFQWNAGNVKPVEHVKSMLNPTNEAEYLSIFESTPDSKHAGDAPAEFQATWRYDRSGKMGSEQTQLQKNYNENLPRAYTRLHLFDAAGLRALRADLDCHQLKYQLACVMLQKRGESLESAFPAIVEPYRDKPFIKSASLLPVPDNEQDAMKAVALRIETVNGHRDFCFADGRPEKVRRAGALRVSGEFAYLSTDAQGLRQASLTGGTLLEGPGVTIKVAQRHRTARVTKVDYADRMIWIDSPWPAATLGKPFEIGNELGWTSYTPAAVAPDGPGAKITLKDGALLYRSEVTQVVSDTPRVDAVLTSVAFNGGRRGFTLTNDDASRSWKVTEIKGNDFSIDGPVSASDFEPAKAVRIWEYGTGDTLRQSTHVSVRRLDDGAYVVQGDTDAGITVNGKTLRITADALSQNNGRVRIAAK